MVKRRFRELLNQCPLLRDLFVSFFYSLQQSKLSDCFPMLLEQLNYDSWQKYLHIVQDCNCYPCNLTKLFVKSNLTFGNISDENYWKIPFFRGIII